MHVAVLTYVENEGERAYDEVVPQVARALRDDGHEVSIIGVHGDVRKLVSRLTRKKPDLVFNLMETFGDHFLGDVGAVGLLELLG